MAAGEWSEVIPIQRIVRVLRAVLASTVVHALKAELP